jgi:hypothetical protein
LNPLVSLDCAKLSEEQRATLSEHSALKLLFLQFLITLVKRTEKCASTIPSHRATPGGFSHNMLIRTNQNIRRPG